MAMKSYPPEFKADAVALYLSHPGRTLASVAGDLGISTSPLGCGNSAVVVDLGVRDMMRARASC
ncbi:transposase [Nonomuraea sp. KC401]|nr:transposase [Nonomuraea sp. K271]TLF81821.1 transposase [Nonomuraea sp. KC401]